MRRWRGFDPRITTTALPLVLVAALRAAPPLPLPPQLTTTMMATSDALACVNPILCIERNRQAPAWVSARPATVPVGCTSSS